MVLSYPGKFTLKPVFEKKRHCVRYSKEISNQGHYNNSKLVSRHVQSSATQSLVIWKSHISIFCHFPKKPGTDHITGHIKENINNTSMRNHSVLCTAKLNRFLESLLVLALEDVLLSNVANMERQLPSRLSTQSQKP